MVSGRQIRFDAQSASKTLQGFYRLTTRKKLDTQICKGLRLVKPVLFDRQLSGLSKRSFSAILISRAPQSKTKSLMCNMVLRVEFNCQAQWSNGGLWLNPRQGRPVLQMEIRILRSEQRGNLV